MRAYDIRRNASVAHLNMRGEQIQTNGYLL